MSKKRIFFLINSMEGGGAERVISNIVLTLKDMYEIDIITLKEGLFYDLPKEVHVIPLSQIKYNIGLIISFPILLYRFRKLLSEKQYLNGISFLEIANFINILGNPHAIISFRTNIEVFKGMLGFFYKKCISLLYPKAQKIIVNSEENRYDLAKYLSIPIDKITTLYNPINIEDIEKLKTEPLEKEILEKIHGKRVFITVGRLVKDEDIGSKNHSLILNILHELIAQGEKNIAYLIVGDGPAMTYLKQQVSAHQLSDYVIFTEKQKNVFKYLSHAQYMIYASRNEGFPNALIEAIAVGVPIITSNFKTGATEVIMGKYEEDSRQKFPQYGPNGVILDLNCFREQFFEIYPKLDTILQKKRGLERFKIDAKTVEDIFPHSID
ncbi:glycosyltransferase [Candidatus Gracilibacteria bacterium]|nr:glycosyltransferase [Candidatus Gracilibacteria bacterium]